jgi:hypothetical protein
MNSNFFLLTADCTDNADFFLTSNFSLLTSYYPALALSAAVITSTVAWSASDTTGFESLFNRSLVASLCRDDNVGWLFVHRSP